MMDGAKAGSRARGLDRAIEILDCLSDSGQPLRPVDIANALGAPKSSIYQLINVLIDLGVLEFSGNDGQVFLGKRVSFWGNSYLKNFDLTREAKPLLDNISQETGETTQFSMLDGNKYVVMMMREGSRPFRISADVGKPVPIPWTASGRLLLSHLSLPELKEFVPEPDFDLPDGSRLEPEEFYKQAQDAKDASFFSFDSVTDSFTHCFAAGIEGPGGQITSCVCIVAPKADAERNFESYKSKLMDVAKTLKQFCSDNKAH